MFGKLTRQAGALTLSRSLGQVLNVVAGMLIVRALTQFDYGTYRQLILMYSSVLLIGDLGFAQSLYHFIPRQRKQARIFLGQALLVTAGISLLWTTLLLALSGAVGNFFSNPDLSLHMQLLAAYVCLSLLARILEAGLIAVERTGAASANTAIFETMRFVFVLGAVLWNASITWLLAAMGLAAFLRLLSLLWLARAETALQLTPQLPTQFRYALVLWIPGLMASAAIYAHQYIVGYSFSTEQYAVYAVACFQVPFMGVLASSLNEVFLVRATQYAGQGDRQALYQLWINACRKATLIFLPVTVGLAVLARPLIVFFNTDRYVEAVPYFVVILLALPFSALFQDGVLRAFAALRAYSLIYALRVVLSIGLGIVGVRVFGLWGAAASVPLATLILNAVQLAKVAQLLGVPMRRVLPWRDINKELMASALACVPAMVVVHFVTQPLLALALGTTLFAAAYLLVAVRLDLVKAEEVAALVEGIRLIRFQQGGLR